MKLLSQLPFWVWGLLIILYILSPIDLIPDLLGFPGRLDDFLIVLGAVYFLQSRSKKRLRDDGSDHAGGDDRYRAGEQKHQASGNRSSQKSPPKPEDP